MNLPRPPSRSRLSPLWAVVLLTSCSVSPVGDGGDALSLGDTDAGPVDAGFLDSGIALSDSGSVDAGQMDAGLGDGGGSSGLTIETLRVPFAKVSSPYATSLYVAPTGTAPYSWSVTGLPSGLSMTAAGVLSGTPATVGVSTLLVTVSDSSPSPLVGTASLTLIVYDGSLPDAIDQSFFGINIHDTLGNSHVLPLVGVDKNPFGTMRLWDTRTMWLDLEPSQNVFDFNLQDASLDAFMSYARANSVSVLYEVGQTPAWAADVDGLTSCKYAMGSCDAPRDWDAGDAFFKTYLTTLVARYGSSANSSNPQTGCSVAEPQCHGTIAMYELWNEPSDVHEWSETQSSQGENVSMPAFIQVTNDAYDALRADDPRAKIISPSGYLPWMDTHYFDGGGIMGPGNSSRAFDAISIHDYSAYGSGATFVPEQMIREKKQWDAVFKTYGINVPSVVSEGGMGPDDNGFTTEAQKADYVARYLLLTAAQRQGFSVWYTWGGLQDAGHLNALGEAYHYVGNWLLGAKVIDAGCMDSTTGKLGTFDACAPLDGNGASTYVVNLQKPSGTAQAVWYVAFDGGTADWSATTAYDVPAQLSVCQSADDGSACVAGAGSVIGAEPMLFMTKGYALP
jgi:hypothetical protein